MKGISPIIATILLIVMTVAIAGLMYAWLSGLFSSLTTSTGNQVNKLTQIPSFYVSSMYTSSPSSIYAVIYNNGNVPVALSSVGVIAQEEYSENDTYDGITYSCNITTSGVVSPGAQNTVSLNCSTPSGLNNSNIVSNINSGSNYYLFSYTYQGVTEDAQLT